LAHFIKPCEGRLTSHFGWRTIHGKREWHQGVDLAQAGNVKILASAGGEVIRVGALGTYGYIVIIKHMINGKRMDTLYAHLKTSILVKVGHKVEQGQQIAWMGNTDGGSGRSTGQHLHFEIHNGAWATGQPNAVDPMLYLNKKEEEPKKVEPKKAEPISKEVDEMAEQLPKTQQDDMKKLLQQAYDKKLFSVNHTSKVNTMTRGQAIDLLISYIARKG